MCGLNRGHLAQEYKNKKKRESSYLDYRRIVYESKIATTEHGIRAIGRVVANAALTRIQLIVDNSHFEEGRITTNSQTKENRLGGGQKEDEQKHSAKDKSNSINSCHHQTLKNEDVFLPNVAESLHEILADESGAAMPRRNGQFKCAAAALAHRPAAGRRAAAAAARIASVAAGATATSRARTASIGAAAAVLQIEEALLRVEGGRGRVVVALIVERVHLVDVLMIVGRLVAVRVHHAVAGRTESQANNAVIISYR